MSYYLASQLNNNTVSCLEHNKDALKDVKNDFNNLEHDTVLNSKTTNAVFKNLKLINSSSKISYEDNVKRVLDDPLFDKNNSKFLSKRWRENANYFLDRNQYIFNDKVRKAFEENNDELINLLLDNGLNYIDKCILCVDPNLYSHSAIILKFNKPIKFNDSNTDVAAILYTLSVGGPKTNRVKKTFYKLYLTFRKLLGFIFPMKFEMSKVLLTSYDLSLFELENKNTILDYAKLDGQNVKCVLNSTLHILDTFQKTQLLNLVNYNSNSFNDLLKTLTTDIEKISYFFNIYNVNMAKDKFVYNFDNNTLNLKLSHSENGYSIYDFLFANCQELSLTYNEKLHVVKRFLELECLNVLKKNHIINKKATTFHFDDFYKLSERIPVDLSEKFRYIKTTTFDLSKEPYKHLTLPPNEVAKRGYKLFDELESFNKDRKFYSFFKKNCITTLEKVISNCSTGFSEVIKNANNNLNIVTKKHPLSVFNEIKKINDYLKNITR